MDQFLLVVPDGTTEPIALARLPEAGGIDVLEGRKSFRPVYGGPLRMDATKAFVATCSKDPPAKAPTLSTPAPVSVQPSRRWAPPSVEGLRRGAAPVALGPFGVDTSILNELRMPDPERKPPPAQERWFVHGRPERWATAASTSAERPDSPIIEQAKRTTWRGLGPDLVAMPDGWYVDLSQGSTGLLPVFSGEWSRAPTRVGSLTLLGPMAERGKVADYLDLRDDDEIAADMAPVAREIVGLRRHDVDARELLSRLERATGPDPLLVARLRALSRVASERPLARSLLEVALEEGDWRAVQDRAVAQAGTRVKEAVSEIEAHAERTIGQGLERLRTATEEAVGAIVRDRSGTASLREELLAAIADARSQADELREHREQVRGAAKESVAAVEDAIAKAVASLDEATRDVASVAPHVEDDARDGVIERSYPSAKVIETATMHDALSEVAGSVKLNVRALEDVATSSLYGLLPVLPASASDVIIAVAHALAGARYHRVACDATLVSIDDLRARSGFVAACAAARDGPAVLHLVNLDLAPAVYWLDEVVGRSSDTMPIPDELLLVATVVGHPYSNAFARHQLFSMVPIDPEPNAPRKNTINEPAPTRLRTMPVLDRMDMPRDLTEGLKRTPAALMARAMDLRAARSQWFSAEPAGKDLGTRTAEWYRTIADGGEPTGEGVGSTLAMGGNRA